MAWHLDAVEKLFGSSGNRMLDKMVSTDLQGFQLFGATSKCSLQTLSDVILKSQLF
jgi:hypothetical protein